MEHDFLITAENAFSSGLNILGGKAYALARLEAELLPIPKWFAVTNKAFFQSLSPEQINLYNSGETDKLLQSEISISAEIAALINAQTADMDCRFAVRSSAAAEDNAEASFAGQFDSFLWVDKADICEYVVKVWLSAFSERIKAYRENNCIKGALEIPTVIVQKMVHSEAAGVAFAVNPISGNVGEALVSAVFGFGSALVDGEASADTYTVSGGAVTNREIAEKDVMHVAENGRVITAAVPKDKKIRPVLTNEQAVEIAVLSQATSRFFGKFQDIEWAYEKGRLFLLQSRPITTLSRVSIEKGKRIIFDNSNIAESYGSVTMPLTSSFISYVYEQVYIQFCKVFGVSKKKLDEHEMTFKTMLGFADGRVYYNLLSWYKMLSILPGYALNRKFMEQMMGVKEPLPQEFLDKIKPPSTKKERFSDGLSLVKTAFKILGQWFGLEKSISHFYSRVEFTLIRAKPESMSLGELYDFYYSLENSLMRHWDAPLVNDFFTMIFHGMLRSFCAKNCKNPEIHNDLLCGQGGIISAEPAERVREMADLIAGDTELISALSSGSRADARRAVAANEHLSIMVDAYIQKFGDRCLDELKLESESLAENPLTLYRAIGALAAKKERAGEDREKTRKAAIDEVYGDLKGKLFLKKKFDFLRKNAARLVRNRENLRFERTRVFGMARRIFLEMGTRLASYGKLEDRRDVFLLTRGELLSYIDGTASSSNFKELVKIRRAEYEQNKAKPNPPRRFSVNDFAGGARTDMLVRKSDSAGQKSLRGLACCPGVVTGVARVIVEPENASMRDGEILVAARTDPGWIMLFNLAAAIVVERGSLLSHAAIVSREMGIPAVVSVDGATEIIKDGDTIQVDGSAGTVEIIR